MQTYKRLFVNGETWESGGEYDPVRTFVGTCGTREEAVVARSVQPG
jgi:hypothetical protein